MFDKVLSMPPVLNIPGLWIAQNSEYPSGFEYAEVLNIPEFWICQSYTGFKICLNNTRIIPEHCWICLNMPVYVWICVNMPKFAWIGFSSFFHLFYNPFSTWTRGYLFEHILEVIVGRNMRLFSWRDKIWYFI